MGKEKRINCFSIAVRNLNAQMYRSLFMMFFVLLMSATFFFSNVLVENMRLTSKAGLKQIDEFFEKHGRMSILIARLLPFMSFDIVSYAAGLTSMSFWSFFVATGIGQLPATIIYSYVGGMLTGGAKLFVTGLLLLFSISALVVLFRQLYVERQKKKAKK